MGNKDVRGKDGWEKRNVNNNLSFQDLGRNLTIEIENIVFIKEAKMEKNEKKMNKMSLYPNTV